MDLLYGHDRKLGYLEEPDMIDILNSNDNFLNPMGGFPNPEECYESDWLTSILDDPVLNDKMMTDAMQPPCIKSEHSYSINENEPGSPLGLAKCEDMESDYFTHSALDLTMKSVSTSPAKSSEASLPDSIQPPSTSESSPLITTTAAAPSPSTISISPRQPTIIVTTSTPSASGVSSFYNRDLSFPTIKIKKEPLDSPDQSMEQSVSFESIVLPPTPPGSSGSDSDGSQSPQRSAPSSPIRPSSARHHQQTTSSLGPSKTYTQPLFVNPISQSGVLILSEEEKRTLISEGYPIPSKLPLTKQEEKNLKKIRRKIKNKISAQESRRKKKEYLEALEKRVEAFNHENSDLKKKVENLESNNRSLLGQLQKLQSLVSKVPKATASQTGTALMVLVFCFAVFLGSMSPSSLNIGYSNKPRMLGFVPHQQPEIQRTCYGPEMGPIAMGAHDTSDPYSTPTLKSRMLMSVEHEEQCDEYLPMPWDASYSSGLCQVSSQKVKAEEEQTLPEPGVDLRKAAAIVEENTKTTPDTTVVMVMAGMENKSDSTQQAYQSSVVPGVTVGAGDVMVEDASKASLSAEMGTA